MDLLMVLLLFWWLAVIPGIFLITTFEAISDLIRAKARELWRKND